MPSIPKTPSAALVAVAPAPQSPSQLAAVQQPPQVPTVQRPGEQWLTIAPQEEMAKHFQQLEHDPLYHERLFPALLACSGRSMSPLDLAHLFVNATEDFTREIPRLMPAFLVDNQKRFLPVMLADCDDLSLAAIGSAIQKVSLT